MSPPETSGDFLRAIAGSYRRELGPARAEQLVSRAMARAGGHKPSRFPTMARAASAVALALSLVAVGLIVLLGDGGAVTDSDAPAPVASSPLSDTTMVEESASPVVSIPTDELQEALDLIDQQKEVEAAEVVVRALSAIVSPGSAENVAQSASPPPADVSPPSPTGDAGEQTRSPGSSTGGVPPEQATRPGETSAETGEANATEAGTSEGASGESDPPSSGSSQSTIEELGQALKVEVEELLSADPQDLADAAEEARNAATPILEYGQEPSIILPSGE